MKRFFAWLIEDMDRFFLILAVTYIPSAIIFSYALFNW